jgi:methionine-rich copper-binding protein CopC
MVHKIEGAPGITGGQMPLGETPLPQATIDAIRQWITNGAPNAPAAAAALFAVQTTAPVDQSVVRIAPASILVSFTADVDASLVNSTTVTLERIDGPLSVVTGDAQRIPARSALAAHNSAVLVITPNTVLAPGIYRVTLRGGGGGALANMNAATLGADSTFEFTVEPAP